MAEERLRELGPIELYRLSEGIQHNIGIIKSGVCSLKKMMTEIGGSNDNVKLRERIQETQRTMNGVVPETARNIRQLDASAPPTDQLQQIQVERLTQAFRDALADYTAVQKEVTEKMAAHVSLQARTHDNPFGIEQQAIADNEESSLLAKQQAQAQLVEETRILIEKEVYIDGNDADVVDKTIKYPAAVFNHPRQTFSPESRIGPASANVEAGNSGLAVERYRMSTKQKFCGGALGMAFIFAIIRLIIFLFKETKEPAKIEMPDIFQDRVQDTFYDRPIPTPTLTQKIDYVFKNCIDNQEAPHCKEYMQ